MPLHHRLSSTENTKQHQSMCIIKIAVDTNPAYPYYCVFSNNLGFSLSKAWLLQQFQQWLWASQAVRYQVKSFSALSWTLVLFLRRMTPTGWRYTQSMKDFCFKSQVCISNLNSQHETHSQLLTTKQSVHNNNSDRLNRSYFFFLDKPWLLAFDVILSKTCVSTFILSSQSVKKKKERGTSDYYLIICFHWNKCGKTREDTQIHPCFISSASTIEH